jgi:hypothetical protein
VSEGLSFVTCTLRVKANRGAARHPSGREFYAQLPRSAMHLVEKIQHGISDLAGRVGFDLGERFKDQITRETLGYRTIEVHVEGGVEYRADFFHQVLLELGFF